MKQKTKPKIEIERCVIINKKGDIAGWEHKWYILSQQSRTIKTFFKKNESELVIAFTKCERCGKLDYFSVQLPAKDETMRYIRR